MARSKEYTQSNFRVTVEPYVSPWSSAEPDPKRLKRDCDEIAASIKRHVDDIGSATVECDTKWHCEYCNSEWTERDGAYNGGCCAKDEENNPENVKETT